MQNFYIQLMRKFYGKPAATIKYLKKRKRKRKEFKKRLNAYDYSSYNISTLEPSHSRTEKETALHPAPDKFSDDESSTSDENLEYNYYTDSDEEQLENQTAGEENE